MAIKQVITGIEADGTSIFMAAGTAPHVTMMFLEPPEAFDVQRWART